MDEDEIVVLKELKTETSPLLEPGPPVDPGEDDDDCKSDRSSFSNKSGNQTDKQKACRHHMRLVLAVLVGTGAFTTACLAMGLPPLLSRPPSEEPLLPPQPSPSRLGVYRRAAISADTALCPSIGRAVLARNGTAVDAAVATLLCQGVAAPHLSGLAGGFFMVAYTPRGGARVLDVRETAPLNPAVLHSSPRPGMLVAVSGAARGLWEAHRELGRLPWADLVRPAARLCELGVYVSRSLARHLQMHRNVINSDPILREVFTDPSSGDLLHEGDMLRNQRLAATLRTVAEEGGDALQTGPLANAMSDEIRRAGGVVSVHDLANYRPRWRKAVTSQLVIPRLGALTLHTSPPPSSGAVLAHMLNVFEAFNMTAADNDDIHSRVVTMHRIIETFKHAFAKRPLLGDPEFVNVDEVMRLLLSKEYARSVRLRVDDLKTVDDMSYYGPVIAQPQDYGTTHVSIVGPGGDAVSITASLNYRFGSGFMSNRTGLIFNNHMEDFSRPGLFSREGTLLAFGNFVEPGKRPLSSMSPSIFTDSEGRVRLVVGASGSLRITTSIAFVCARHLWLNEDIKQAIDARRIHHQLIPNTVLYENGLTRQMLRGLHHRGHRTQKAVDTFSVVTAVVRADNGTLFANSDFRQGGDVEGLN